MNDITIAIATWNAEAFIDKTLEAAKKQGYPIVCADNTSTDKTREVLTANGLESLTFEHTLLKWDNVYRAYQTLVNAVSTEFVFILDHDVILPEGAVDSCYNMLVADPKLGAVAIPYGGSHPCMGATIFRTKSLQALDWTPATNPRCSCSYVAEELKKQGLQFVNNTELKADHIKNGHMASVKQSMGDIPDVFEITVTTTKKVNLTELNNKIANLRRDLAEALNLRNKLLGKENKIITTLGGVK